MSTDHRDAIDAFRDANPVDPTLAESFTGTAESELALGRIISSRPHGPTRWWRRRFVVPLAAVVALGAAAAGYATSQAPDDPTSVACYTGPSTTSDAYVVVPGADGPIAACQALWTRGVGPGPAGPSGGEPLQGCILSSGAEAVFPSDDPTFCASHELSAASAFTPRDREIDDLQEHLAALASANRCITAEEAQQAARAALAANGLGDWRVTIPEGAAETRPCMTFLIQPLNDALVVIGLPR